MRRMATSGRGILIAGWCALAIGTSAWAQDEAPRRARREWAAPGAPAPAAPEIDAAVAAGVKHLLEKQESLEAGDEGPRAEWPYEGVYRVGGEIPIGYRVGGTSIASLALLRAPGFGEDAARREAVERAARFVVAQLDHAKMNPDYDGGYDVRGWGYTYALLFVLEYEARAPENLRPSLRPVAQRLVDAIQATEISQVGGWNYARPRGKDKVAPPSPFMTAPTLEALFEAAAAGLRVDPAVVARGVRTLEQARTPSGAIVYSGAASARAREGTPGAVGRMLAAQAVLALAGRSTEAEVRAALDAFIVHWPWLEQRRAKGGTHEGPYAIAPYYFYYAHRAAARAIELLPEHERAEYRRRVNQLLFATRAEDGTWNDRVFPRSSAFGTAMAMLALLEPTAKAPARWKGEAPAAESGVAPAPQPAPGPATASP